MTCLLVVSGLAIFMYNIESGREKNQASLTRQKHALKSKFFVYSS